MQTPLTQLLSTAATLRLIDDLPLPLMVYRQDGLLVAMNRQAELFWAAKRNDIVGRFNLLEDPQSAKQGSRRVFSSALLGEQILTQPSPYDTSKAAVGAMADFAPEAYKQIWIRARFFPLHEEDGSISHVALMHEDVTELIERNAEIDHARREIERQRGALDTLSSPVIQVWDGILTAPLVGVIDARRAMAITEKLLEAIVAYQADIVILDITGVPVVDTSVANALLQAAQAVNLLGSQVVLVGVGAELAQTFVHLGVDLSRVTTLANLKAGISWAFAQLGVSAGA